jgi:hypothetical protein
MTAREKRQIHRVIELPIKKSGFSSKLLAACFIKCLIQRGERGGSMTVVGVIGAIVFFAIIGLALLAVFEILLAPSSKHKAEETNDPRHKRHTWYRKREAVVHRDEAP